MPVQSTASALIAVMMSEASLAFRTTRCGREPGCPPGERHNMSAPVVTVLDWGRPEAPMVVTHGTMVLTLNRPDRPTLWDQRCADYAAYSLASSPALDPGRKSVDLGFYGYLRVCNSRCIGLTRVSIFDLADATWRDWYDEQVPPEQAVSQTLLGSDYPASAEEE